MRAHGGTIGRGITAALAAAVLVALPGCTSAAPAPRSTAHTAAARSFTGSPSGGPATSSASDAPTPTPAGAPVHVSLFEGDGQTYGVGFAIIADFDVAPTDSRAFTKAVRVSVNGAPAGGAWFWQHSAQPGVAIEALYRPQTFWPAHASIAADLPLKGLSAGAGLVFANSLTLSVSTGAAHVATVDDATHEMTVTSDSQLVRTMPVSLGGADTPTYSGTKVVMTRGEDLPGTKQPRPDGAVRMVSTEPGNSYDLLVPWSVRVTDSGEYIHAASWNTGNIGSRNTSHGCTNLDVADAQWFYQFSQVGDVVQYPNAAGPTMPSWDGWGWWNLPWSQWSQGGLLLNH